MARAVGEGHRVVVVYATNGDHGDRPDDLAAELQDRGGAGKVVGETRAEEILAAGENQRGAAGALFGDLAERRFHRVAGEQRA